MKKSKGERLEIFCERLSESPAATSFDEARALLEQTLTRVEDEFSGVPAVPESPQRMYPPYDDNRRNVPDRPDLVRFRSRGHNTFFSSSGAILIVNLKRQVIFEKSGADGRLITETFNP